MLMHFFKTAMLDIKASLIVKKKVIPVDEKNTSIIVLFSLELIFFI